MTCFGRLAEGPIVEGEGEGLDEAGVAEPLVLVAPLGLDGVRLDAPLHQALAVAHQPVRCTYVVRSIHYLPMRSTLFKYVPIRNTLHLPPTRVKEFQLWIFKKTATGGKVGCTLISNSSDVTFVPQ
jgi:hypothetical protein